MIYRCLPPGEPIDLVNVAFQRNPDLPSDNNLLKKNKTKVVRGAYGMANGKDKSQGEGKRKQGGGGKGDQSTGNQTSRTRINGAVPEQGLTEVQRAEEPVKLELSGMDELDLDKDHGGHTNLSAAAPDAADPSISPIRHDSSNHYSDPHSPATSLAHTTSPDTQSGGTQKKEQPPNGLTPAEYARMIAEHDYKVPDRIAGYEAVAELRKCCVGREFRFVLVNVTYAVRPSFRAVASVQMQSWSAVAGVLL